MRSRFLWSTVTLGTPSLLVLAVGWSCGGGSDGSTSGASSISSGGSAPASSSSAGGGAAGAAGATVGGGGTGGSGAFAGNGGTTGDGGTGSARPTGTDTCPGEAYTLAPGQSLVLPGTTAGAADDHTSFCGDTSSEADAGDVVYAFTFEQPGTVKLSVAGVGSDLKPAVYLRSDCATDELCYPSMNGVAKLAKAIAAGTYHVIVDGAPGTSGAFELDISFDTAQCGDAVIDPGEDCDPGASVADDGCGDTGQADACKFQPAPAAQDDCPGEMVSIPAGVTILQGSTYGYGDDHNSKPTGSCPDSGGGRDRVYKLVPQQNGQKMVIQIGLAADGMTEVCAVDVTSPGCWDWKIYARSTCSIAEAEIACSDEGAITAETILIDNVSANSSYYLFVDGYDGSIYSYGPFNLKITLLQ